MTTFNAGDQMAEYERLDTPAPEGEVVAWRTVPVEPTEAMLVNGREALMPTYRLLTCGPLIGVWKDMLAASPVVPAPEGEAWKALRRVAEMQADGERTKSVMIANWIIQGVAKTASPVVSVGREDVEIVSEWLEIAKETPKPLHSSLNYVPVCASEIEAIERILAALGTKATDTGGEG